MLSLWKKDGILIHYHYVDEGNYGTDDSYLYSSDNEDFFIDLLEIIANTNEFDEYKLKIKSFIPLLQDFRSNLSTETIVKKYGYRGEQNTFINIVDAHDNYIFSPSDFENPDVNDFKELVNLVDKQRSFWKELMKKLPVCLIFGPYCGYTLHDDKTCIEIIPLKNRKITIIHAIPELVLRVGDDAVYPMVRLYSIKDLKK